MSVGFFMFRTTAMNLFISSRYLRLQRTTVHPLLAIFIPLLFLLSIDPILRVLLPFLRLPSALFYPFLLLTALEEALAGNILFQERASFWARVRELFFVIIGAFLYLQLLRKLTASGKGMFRVELIYPLSLVLVQWLFSVIIHRGLRERELLLRALVGKRASEMLHAFRDSSYQAEIAMQSLRGSKGIIFFFQSLIFSLLLIVAIRGVSLGFWGRIAAAVHAGSGMLCVGLLNLFIENQLLLGNGIVVTRGFEKRRMVFNICLLAVSALLVLAAAKETSLLPLSALLAFLEKLSRIFRLKEDPRMAQLIRTLLEERRRYYEVLLSLQGLPGGQVNPLFLLILELLRRFFVTVLGTAFFLFLAAPLLSESFMQSLKERKPLAFLWKKLRGLYRFCFRLVQQLLVWLRSHGKRGRLLAEQERKRHSRQGSGKTLAAKISLRKRLQMSRVLKAFLQLRLWGERLGVRYYPFNTPQEFALRLAGAVPGTGPELFLVVDVFEEVLFSSHLVAAERISRYFSTVRSLQKRH